MWGQRRTQPDIDLGDGEAVLVERAPAPFRWLVSKQRTALHVVRGKGGHDSYLCDSFGIGRDWHPATTLREFAMAGRRGVKIPIAESEADHLVEVILRRREQWSRAYWALGN